MANGKIRFGKQSGGTLGLVFPDGVSNTEVILPESGELVTKDYVDTGAGVAFVANDNRVKTALNATGTAPIYACRAWVNFNGTGTVAIGGSGNVSSIIDNGTGDYSIIPLIPLPTNNMAISGSTRESTSGNSDSGFTLKEVANNPIATSIRIQTYAGGFGAGDCQFVSVSIIC